MSGGSSERTGATVAPDVPFDTVLLDHLAGLEPLVLPSALAPGAAISSSRL
jgi:hypothetical protein